MSEVFSTGHKVFTFTDRDNFSKKYSGYLDNFYRTVWDIDYIEIVSDRDRQIRGVDKILHLKDGNKLHIDEKIESIKQTDNIVFEDKTDIDADKDGWLTEGQLTDYVVFYQVNMNKIYVIPFNLMLKMHLENRDIWMKSGRERIIMNKTPYGYYRGRIYLVPKPELYDYMSTVGNIPYEKIEYSYTFS